MFDGGFVSDASNFVYPALARSVFLNGFRAKLNFIALIHESDAVIAGNMETLNHFGRGSGTVWLALDVFAKHDKPSNIGNFP